MGSRSAAMLRWSTWQPDSVVFIADHRQRGEIVCVWQWARPMLPSGICCAGCRGRSCGWPSRAAGWSRSARLTPASIDRGSAPQIACSGSATVPERLLCTSRSSARGEPRSRAGCSSMPALQLWRRDCRCGRSWCCFDPAEDRPEAPACIASPAWAVMHSCSAITSSRCGGSTRTVCEHSSASRVPRSVPPCVARTRRSSASSPMRYDRIAASRSAIGRAQCSCCM
jgi:hypothetical protein